MLPLSNKFKTRIIHRYGQEGEKWLESIDFIIAKYKDKFELKNMELIKNLSMNIVILANSGQFGDVILKIGSPGQSSINEINAMKYYSSNYVAKCYYSSTVDKVILLERILPGYSLDHLETMEERIQVFCELSNQLLVISNGKEDLLSFEELLKKDLEYVYKNKYSYSNILWMFDKTKSIYAKIKEMNLPKYILHDDLHHKNILKSQDNWKAIDPHGIIGEKVLETCQFLRTELQYIELEENEINKIVALLSHYYHENKKLILEMLYIYITRKIVFYSKNKYDNDTISYNINICKKLLDLLKE